MSARSRCLPRHDHAQLFGDQLRLALAPDSRRIEKAIRLSVSLDHRVHRVARRPRLGRHDRPLRAHQLIQQRRFAHVRPPDDGDVDVRLGLDRLARAENPSSANRAACRRRSRARPKSEKSRRPARRIARRVSACFGESTLFTASTGGLPARRSSCASSASSGTGPARPSTTCTTRAAFSIAMCACRRISPGIPALSSGTIPPVSTTSNARPSQFAMP